MTLITGGMAYAQIEWQRIDYRPTGVTASPRVRMTLGLPLGERIAVDFLDTSGSACRADALIFEIGVAPDHGTRLSMSAEGRPVTGGIAAGGRGGGGAGAGRPITADEAANDAERRRQGEEAARAAATITRPMPPREYQVDQWLLRDVASSPHHPDSRRSCQRRLAGRAGGSSFLRTLEPPGRIIQASSMCPRWSFRSMGIALSWRLLVSSRRPTAQLRSQADG